VAHSAALISISVALSQTPAYTRDHGYGASASRGVAAHFRAVGSVPNYTDWWPRHHGANNLPRVTARPYPVKTRTRYLPITNSMLYQVFHHAAVITGAASRDSTACRYNLVISAGTMRHDHAHAQKYCIRRKCCNSRISTLCRGEKSSDFVVGSSFHSALCQP